MAKFTMLTLALVFASILPTQAGTTGSLSGYVLDMHQRPVSEARIRATSSVQIAATVTDAHGYFVFANLMPCTYALVASKNGYVPASKTVEVIADVSASVALILNPKLYMISEDFSWRSNLAKPGITADVYSRWSGWAEFPTLPNSNDQLRYTPGVLVPLLATPRAIP